jgi:hypothetical protein
VAFPQTPLAVQIEAQIGGTWTDVTTDTYTENRIVIERGRPDEGQRTDPGKMAMVLNNRSGKYSPRNPLSPYYGLIGRNTPMRVSVLAGTPFLRLVGTPADFASTPHVTALGITGDIDVRMDAQLTNWLDASEAGSVSTTELVGKHDSPTAKSWFLGVRGNRLYLEWSADGTSSLSASSTVELVVPPSGRLAVRAVLDVNNGAGGRTVTFYTAPSGTAGPWTQLGAAVIQAGTTSLFNATTVPLRVGSATNVNFTTAAGACMAVEVRSGIGGTVVANPDFTAQTIGATSFVDGAGRTWTLAGGTQITNRRTRFIGEVSSWPSRWDVSGKDVRVPIEGAGVLRRYGQGKKAFDSTLRRRIPSGSPLAYWPMEDGEGATQAFSPITGVRPLQLRGFNMASGDSLAGSAPLPSIQGGATLAGSVPAPAGSPTSWHCEFVYRVPSSPGTARTILQWLGTGTVRRWQLQLTSIGANVLGYDADGTVVTSSILALGTDVVNAWTRWQLYASQNGGNVDWTVTYIPIGGSGGSAATSFAGTVGRISGVSGPEAYSSDLNGTFIGHIATFTTANTTIYNSADLGFAGETAGARLRRLASEEGKPITVHGDVTDEEQLGPQKAKTFLDLVEECADVDGGILYERRSQLALAYRDRVSMYNQTPALTLDYLAPGHIAPPLEPAPDDQDVRNDIEITREGGSSERAVLETGALSIQAPPDGVGPYDESLTLNLYSDSQPSAHAGWRLRLGTVDDARYPEVNLDLAAAPSLIDAVTALEIGDRITIANPPSWMPPGPIDLIVMGYTETIGHPTDWEFTLNCVPAAPWNVGWIGDATTARTSREFGWTDGDFSQLATALTSSDTTVPLLTASGPVWSGAVADTPWDWNVGGETVTVTAPGTLLNPNAFFDSSVANWTAQSSAIGWSSAAVCPHPRAKGSMLITPDGVSATGGALGDLTGVGSINPGGIYVLSAWVLSPGGSSDLQPAVNWYDSGGALISSVTGSSMSATAGVWTYLEQTFTAPSTASQAKVRMRHGGTPAASAVWYVWAARITRIKASWLYDQFGRTVSSGWGNADSSQAWNRVGGGPATDYNIGSGYGGQILSTLDTSRRTAVSAIHPDADIYCDVTTSALATGDSLYAGVCARMPDASNMYVARVEFTTANTIVLAIRKIIADVQTTLGTITLPRTTHAAAQWLTVRFQVQGTALRARAWLAGTIEPGSWQIDVTDSSLTAAAQIGTRSIRSTGNTNAATVEVRYRAFDVINPQLYTVARSANGIVKAQTLAAPVSLATPSYVAL